MIATTLAELARITGGTAHGDESVVVDGPAVVDSRKVVPGSLFVAIAGEHVDGRNFVPVALEAGAVATLAATSVPGPHVLVDDPVKALGLLAADRLRVLRERTELDVVAITGSQGKTSVKDLVAQILSADGPTVAPEGSFNNELGVPLTVLQADESTRHLVLEMGARGIGHIAYLCQLAPPDVAVVLNVGSAHAGEFGSIDQTALAKGEIIEALADSGTAILNADDPRVADMAQRTVATVLTFGRTGSVTLLGEIDLDPAGQPTFELQVGEEKFAATVPQVGAHHALNGAAAVAATTALGISPAQAVAALASAGALSPMRMQRQERADGLVILNDAYNANPESMAAALRTLASVAPGVGVAVLGEMLELGEDSQQAHRQIGELAAELNLELVVAVGPGAVAIADGAGRIGVPVADIAAAIELLRARLSAADVVLVKASRGVRLERVATALLAAE
ncbi:MAG TPA: UDP-N-acetylmuramoyl-tripeptide--D-alanyl-D-alanine ligase [Aeromicrobium sp.]|nr:UDP-N-acetylmuramoyl-tripeptide--D-alanyl-D-alanine ligase [Aeromicrobium sp.]